MKDLKPLLLALLALPLVGCIYKPRSWDSYHSTFYPNPQEPNRADPYTFGGIAEGSGGTITRTSYATDTKSPDPRSHTVTGKSAMFDDERVSGPYSDPTLTIKVRDAEGRLPHGAGSAGTAVGSPAGTPDRRPDINPQKGAPFNAPPMRG
jgi:hypothetical protein